MNLEKEIFDISLEDIIPNRFQPREIFNDNELYELSESIKKHGVIQPIIVRKVGDKYEIIAGERRYRASQLAGKETIPSLVRDMDDKEAAKIALLENLQRSNLTPIEEAKTYQTILKIDNITQDELATTLGKAQSTIANKMRLLTLNDEVQTALLNSQISERHARSLIGLTTSQQIEMLHRIINEKLTVRQLDEEIMKLTGRIPENNIEREIMNKGEMTMENEMINQELNINPQSEVLNTTVPGVNDNNQNQPPVPENNQAMPQMPGTTVEMNNTPVTPNIETPEMSMPQMPQFPTVETGMQQQPVPTVEVPEVNMPQMPAPGPGPEIPQVPETPIPEPVPEVPQVPEAPIPEPVPETPQVPETPIPEPVPEVPQVPEMPVPEPVQEAPQVPEAPIPEPVPEVPQVPETPIPEPVPEVPQVPEMPVPVSEMPQVPEAPIPEPVPEESQNTETNIFDKLRISRDEAQTESQFELKTPDLSAVINESQPQKEDIYDLRFAINNFRQAIQNTEKFGFHVNSTEQDNGNKYQIIIEIEKK